VARITRKELKTDNFALEVGHTLSFFEENQQKIIRYGGIAVAVVALLAIFYVYRNHQSAARQDALARAIEVQEAPVGQSGSGGLSFPTQDLKDQEAVRVFTALENNYSGSTEGEIARYYLGAIRADQGKMAEAEKDFQTAAQKGNAQYSSLAKLSLAQIYFSDGRDTQGEAVLRDLIAHPTLYVSADQATLTLARFIMQKNPAEARKLLDPLRTKSGTVSQVAINLYNELPAK
jgi:hypothetical protein